MADVLGKKISELAETTDLAGLYTIGSDKNNQSKKVSLQFVKEAADYANAQGDYAKTVGDTVQGNTGVDEYPVFSASSQYAAGDVVLYDGRLYKFTALHAAGAWVGTDAVETSIKDQTDSKLTELSAKINQGLETWNGAIQVTHLNLIESWDTSGTRALTNRIPAKPNTKYSFYRGATPTLVTPVAIIQFKADGTQIRSDKASTITTTAETAFVQVDEYKSVVANTMLVEGDVVPTSYLSYEDSTDIVTENEDFNAGVKKIVVSDVLPHYVVEGENIQTNSISINANDWLRLISNNIIDNSTKELGKTVNPTTGALSDYEFSDVTQPIEILCGKKYLILKDVQTISSYDSNMNYIRQEDASKINYISFGEDVKYIRVTIRYNLDGIIVESDDLIDLNQASHLQIRQHSDEVYRNFAENLANIGSKVLVGERYNILTTLMQCTMTNGVFRIAASSGKYVSNRIFEKGTFTFATESDYDLSKLTYSVVKYSEDDTYISQQDFEGVATFSIADGDCAYFRIFGTGRATCLVVGDSAPHGKKDADTLLVQFRNDDYREQIMNDMLLNPKADKLLLKTLFPKLYGKKYVALGDSNTNGSGAIPYCQVLADYFNMPFVNYGIHSSTIAEYDEPGGGYEPMCVRYADMDSDAEVVTIMGGGNDDSTKIGTMTDRQENGQYTLYSGCHKLFKGIMEKYPNAKVGVILSPQNAKGLPTDTEGSGPDIDLKKRETKLMVIKEVAEYYSLPVLDLFHHGGVNGYGSVQRELFYQADKLHLTTAGQARLAEKVIAWIKTL